jgi:predicted nuclease of predicted toxin-antitoxin system
VGEPIRFFFDQHIPAAVANALRQRGVDVLTAQDAARCGLPDTEQLVFATSQERVVVTFDTDYLALDASGLQHAGIAWCPATKYSIGQLIQALLVLHGVLDRAAMLNHVEYL